MFDNSFPYMMNTYYCVFWFPTIFHCEKKPRVNDDKIGPVPISDGDVGNKLELTITKEQQSSYANPFSLTNNHYGAEEFSDLIFTLTNQDGKKFDTRFHCESQTRNGFVVYSYDRGKLIHNYWEQFVGAADTYSDSDKNDRIDTILISFYHYAKQFYHRHETDSESDGKYTSYFYTEHDDGSKEYLTTIPSLSTKNNPVINWYIEQFEKRIVENAEHVSEWFQNWLSQIEGYFVLKPTIKDVRKGNNDERILYCIEEIKIRLGEGWKEVWDKSGDLGDTIDEHRAFLDNFFRNAFPKITDNYYKALSTLSTKCNDSLIEYTYCKTLLESKYNDDYKHNGNFSALDLRRIASSSHVHPEITQRDVRRKKAFNIRNSIRYIEDVKQKCDIWKDRITEILIDEIHDLSNNHEDILKKLKDISSDNVTVLKELKSLADTNTTLTQDVREQIKELKALTDSNNVLTTGVREQIKELKSLTNATNSLTSNIEAQIKKIGTLTENVNNQIKKGEKTNKISIGLGVLSVILAIVFGLLSFRTDCTMNILCQNCDIRHDSRGKVIDSVVVNNDTSVFPERKKMVFEVKGSQKGADSSTKKENQDTLNARISKK